MIFIRSVPEFHSLQQLIGDVAIAGSSHERREPIETGEDSVLNRARFYVSRPADDRRYAESAFPHRALGGLKRSHASVRPREHFGAVVSREENDSIVCFTDFIQMPKYPTDTLVHLFHSGLFQTIVSLGVHHRLIIRRYVGEDVHTGGVMPNEEGLTILLGLVHEPICILDQDVVERLHVVLGLTAFLPP